MPQTIAYPVWKMIWTTTLKTGSWSNKPCMGSTLLCIKFLAASLFSDPRTSFSKPHAILNFNFFVGVKKKTFVFFSDHHLWPEKRLLYLQNFALCVLP